MTAVLATLFGLALASWPLAQISWALIIGRLRHHHPEHWRAIGEPSFLVSPGRPRSMRHESRKNAAAAGTIWLQDDDQLIAVEAVVAVLEAGGDA